MNNNGYDFDRNPDVPDFGSRRDMDTIRMNEDYQRQVRQKRAAELQRQERIKRLKMQQLKQTVSAWAILLFVVFAAIAIITGIFSSSGKDKNKDDGKNVGVQVSSEDASLVSDFSTASYTFSGTQMLSTLNDYTEKNASVLNDYLAYPSYYHIISDSLMFASAEQAASFRNAVRDCAVFSNGYVWSSADSMKHPITDGYLYDTNASFICAVYDICSLHKSLEFLYETDATSSGNKDSSKGMTVLQKVEKASDYFFDENDLNGGGIRYNKEDGLVYILTAENSGVSGSKPSNIFSNHSFGYLDLYNNILFNRSMTALEKLYTDLQDGEKAAFYGEVAKTNKEAINKKFWNSNLDRYMGYTDKNGTVHDAGYTALNLYAISSGVADKDKSEKILSWIDGDRKIGTDTVSYDKVYKSVQLPVFNTIAALNDVWYDKDGTHPYSGVAEFGKYWQNGGISFASAYFNIGARSVSSSDAVLLSNINKFSEAAKNVTPADSEKLFAVSSAFLAAKKAFGIQINDGILYIDPIFSSKESYGLKNLSFAGNRYGLLYKNGKMYITADSSMAVGIKVAAPKDGTVYTLYVVEDGKIASKETPPAGDNGYIDVYKRFGGTSYIILEKGLPKKK